jgi:RNA polymerase sigma factor (sigma-70 family)
MPDKPLPPTSLTLLAALRRGLRWEEFVALYGQQVLLWCRHRFSLQEADAEDVRQELLIKVWKYLGSYDPARGRFRNWLFRCTSHALSDLRQRHSKENGATDQDSLDNLPAPEPGPWGSTGDLDEPLDSTLQFLEEEGFAVEEVQRAVLQVRDRVEPNTWKAFLLSVFLDLKGQEIADRLGMTPMGVYQAVCRVRKLLQRAAGQESLDEPSH